MLKDTTAASTYRIQNRRPALHGHALKHCQHGQADVVEGSDAIVGSTPLFQANGGFGIAGEGAHGSVLYRTGKAWASTVPFEDHFVWNTGW